MLRVRRKDTGEVVVLKYYDHNQECVRILVLMSFYAQNALLETTTGFVRVYQIDTNVQEIRSLNPNEGG